jgi:phage shock protein E
MNTVALLAILVGVTATLAIVYRWVFPPPEALTPAEARSAIKHKDIAIVIDVRTDQEWQQGHAHGALHIPLTDLPRRLPHEVPARDTPILFYCRTGHRASQAAQVAQELGYSTVYYLRNGDYTDLSIKTRFAKY